MKTTAEIAAYLAYRIGCIYYHDRPLSYGGTPAGVELLLDAYHDIWARAESREVELESIWRAELKQEDCGTGEFAIHYSRTHPEADDDEIAQYVIEHWRRVTKQLRVPIPHRQLEQDFADHLQVQKKRFNW
ncbi:MAG: hypothetical protein IT427_04555 [Pirellulales bacterium]|nr:hypothetical protein [Pirellulales bacterium]